MSVHVTEKHLQRAESFVRKARAAGGLAPIDLERYYEDNQRAMSDVWAEDCPQIPISIGMSWECVWGELGLKEDWHRGYHDMEYRSDLCKQYNDLSEKIVGRRLVGENCMPDPTKVWPTVKGLHDIFEGENVWHHESYWLKQAADTPEELAALLDRVEKRLENLREFLLPNNWEEEKARLTALGCNVPRYRGQRGPVTFATSIFGTENLIYLCYDDPELAKRFSDLILKAILGRARILDEEAGFTPETAPRGWYWCDDNCCMLSYDLYEQFAYPIMEGVFAVYSPEETDGCGQHSDSDMAQHLPHFGRLGLKRVNFGPNLTVTEIREHLPNAVISGQLAPFTFSRNEEVNMVAELFRDMEMARDRKGIQFTTAGSINNGSRLTGLRLLMAAAQEFGWGA